MRVEVLEAEAQRVHARVTARAHRIRAMQLEHLAHRCGLARLVALLESWCSRWEAAAARGAARMFSSSHFPRMVGEVRVGYDVTASTLALPEQAPAVLVGERHAPEVAAVDAGNPVVPRPAVR